MPKHYMVISEKTRYVIAELADGSVKAAFRPLNMEKRADLADKWWKVQTFSGPEAWEDAYGWMLSLQQRDRLHKTIWLPRFFAECEREETGRKHSQEPDHA